MILEKIILKGFISFVDEEVDFRQSHITLVYGLNGEGKSALLESIPFCFWGEGRGKVLTEYINDKCDTARVEIYFCQENVRYRKIRQIGKAGSMNELYIDKNMPQDSQLEDAVWRIITDDTKRSTDEELTKILGSSHNVFLNSSFFGQKAASSFIEGGSTERKELLCDLLGSEIYESSEEATKDLLKEIESKVQTKTVVLNDKINIAKNKLDTHSKLINTKKQLQVVSDNLKELNEQIEIYRKKQEKLRLEDMEIKKNKEKMIEINEAIIKAEKSISEIQEDSTQASLDLESTIDDGIKKVEESQAIIDSKDELNKRLDTCKTQLKKITEDKAKITKLKEKLKTFRLEKEQILQQQSEISTIIEMLENRQKRISKSGAICPVTDKQCDQLSDKIKEQLIADLKEEINKQNKIAKDIQGKLDDAKSNILTVDGEMETISKRIENETSVVTKKTTIETDIIRVDEIENNLSNVKRKFRTAVDKLTALVEVLEKRLKTANEELKTLVDKKNEFKEIPVKDIDIELLKLDRQIKASNDDIIEINESKEELTLTIGHLKTEYDQALQAEDDVKEINKSIDSLKRMSRIYTELVFLFGKNGIQKEIISSNVPVLEETANILLSRFTKNNEFSIKFDLDPKTQAGKLKKQGGLDIVVCRKGGIPRSLNMYSGGETVRIVFAILLSLSNLLAKRAGKRSQTLIIDERVAALDVEGINQFIEIVKYISDKYKKILIVSHISELNEAFPNVISVNKDEIKGSLVNYSFK